MSDYPIGSFLVWKPPQQLKIRTRRFAQRYESGVRPLSEESSQGPAYLVLDGQQRLQSLYLGFHGIYDDEYLYFKVNSNPEQDESGVRYEFQFMRSEQAQGDPHWMRLGDIIGIQIPRISTFVDTKFRDDSEQEKERIKQNLGKFIEVFNIREKIVLEDVREDLPYDDILEVFVRVNSGGMVLSKSDLVFSTAVLRVPEMERNFVELVDELNGGGEFDFDIDFIVKTSFVIFDKGAKYDVGKLKDGKYADRLRSDFDDTRRSLLSTLEFLKTDAKILSKRFLKSDLALIPEIDFVFRQPHQHLSEGQCGPIRQYLYMSFFMGFYSYGPDGKLDRIHRIITDSKAPTLPIG